MWIVQYDKHFHPIRTNGSLAGKIVRNQTLKVPTEQEARDLAHDFALGGLAWTGHNIEVYPA